MSEKKELVAAIQQRAKQVEGKSHLNCAQAFEIAKEFSAPVREIGEICNEQGIRICNCQLGCFK